MCYDTDPEGGGHVKRPKKGEKFLKMRNSASVNFAKNGTNVCKKRFNSENSVRTYLSFFI